MPGIAEVLVEYHEFLCLIWDFKFQTFRKVFTNFFAFSFKLVDCTGEPPRFGSCARLAGGGGDGVGVRLLMAQAKGPLAVWGGMGVHTRRYRHVAKLAMDATHTLHSAADDACDDVMR